MRVARSTLLGGAILALTLAACSNGNSGTSAGSGGGASSSPTGQSTGSSAGTTVSVTGSDLGQILVDSQGRTLYMFLSDTGPKSTCYGSCASTWPALTVQGQPSAGSGVDTAMLGTTTRTDGSVQVTLDGHPLYHFSGDQAVGDTNGEGIGGIWFAVSAKGQPVKGGAGSSGGGSSGYSKY